MTQNNTMNKLEQIRHALSSGFEEAEIDDMTYMAIPAEEYHDVMETLDTLIADCSAVDVEALEEALNAEKEYLDSDCNNYAVLIEFNCKYGRYPNPVITESACAYLELMKGKE